MGCGGDRGVPGAGRVTGCFLLGSGSSGVAPKGWGHVLGLVVVVWGQGIAVCPVLRLRASLAPVGSTILDPPGLQPRGMLLLTLSIKG